MKLKYLLLVCFLSPLFAGAQQQFSVFFESNKYDLAADQNAKLNQWIAANPEIKIVAIHGYTDEDGSTGFNDTLANKRVNFIYDAVKSKLKIRDDFKTRSFGEQFPQSKNKAENRKVNIFYIEPKDLARENEILGIKEEAPKPKIPKKYPKTLSLRNPDGTTTQYSLDTDFMRKVDEAKAGEKLKIENLNFQINTFAIVPASRGKLYELLIVLQDNPKLKIDIQGHLCCMPNDRLDLSTQRAKAIYNFLLKNEIDKTRLSYRGFGSSQPIYPLPEKDEKERAANRRVEILIVEN
ncbi:MAG TPA: OmpA family protein [Flavobacterium sp.]|nr:OmpA family protein [Flavobacterium sp.]